MTTRTSAETKSFLLAASVVAALLATAATASAQARSADVRVRLDAARWPSARGPYAGLDWFAVARARGLHRSSVDVSGPERGGVLLRLSSGAEARWLVRVAVASDASVAARAMLRWLQPVQGELVRDDRRIARADVVLVDASGGRARAGFVAGNVALWVAGASPNPPAHAAVELAAALAEALIDGTPTMPAVQAFERTPTDGALRRVELRGAATTDASVLVEGGHVANVSAGAWEIAVHEPRAGARLRATVADRWLRTSTLDLALPPRSR